MTATTGPLSDLERGAIEDLIGDYITDIPTAQEKGLERVADELAALVALRALRAGAPLPAAAIALVERHVRDVQEAIDDEREADGTPSADDEATMEGCRRLLARAAVPRCDHCSGHPAAFGLTAGGEQRCADCARELGERMHGHAEAAFWTLGFAAELARIAGVTDAQLREALQAILTEPHSHGSYPVGGEHVLQGGWQPHSHGSYPVGGEHVLQGGWQRVWTPLAPGAA